MAVQRGARRSARDAGVRTPQAYNGAVREQLADLQRARVIGAMFDVAAQRGAGSVTVAHVVERSGVSRRTFYEHFDDREDCLLAAFERALTLASQRVAPAYEAEKGWRERIRAGLVELLCFCDREPSVARMLVCESQASGPRVAQRRAEVLARLTRIVDQGRTLTGTPKGRTAGKSGKAENVSPLAAEGTVGGVLAVIQARLLEAKPKPLSGLTNELMSMIVLPYLGGAAARRELDRQLPAPASARRGEDALISDPFKDAGMRLTYRTVRVLMAIAQHPQASNRQIGETAGITDQGQISKLLARLERIGLAGNIGMHPGKGAPNSWTLTEKGRRIAENIRAQTSHEGIAA
jgi:AcrR family transcriptional regulator/DNA-binding MarR family transcriptional regulator